MRLDACLSHLAHVRRDELVVTSTGSMSATWWSVTQDTERTFYLEASMSLSSMFGAGLAFGLPDQIVWAFSGDGAFCMNPGSVMVECDLGLNNLTHFVISNGCYGSTGGSPIPNVQHNDLVAVARGFGIRQAFQFGTLAELEAGFDELRNTPGPKFVVLHVEPPGSKLPGCPLDGPELKFRFGRSIERTTGINIFAHQLGVATPTKGIENT